MMATSKTFETDGEFDVARANDVLDLKVRELCVEPKLLNDPSVLAGRKLGIILRLGASDNHLAGGKDQGSGLRFADTHDDGRETLEETL